MFRIENKSKKTKVKCLLLQQFPGILGRQIIKQRAGIAIAWKEMLRAKNKKGNKERFGTLFGEDN